VSLSADDLI